MCKTPDSTNIVVVVLVVVVLIAIVEILIPRVIVIVLRRRPEIDRADILPCRTIARKRLLYRLRHCNLRRRAFFRFPHRFYTKTLLAFTYRSMRKSGIERFNASKLVSQHYATLLSVFLSCP